MVVVKGSKQIISVSISSELADRLREHARKEGERLSQVVEKAIEDYLKDHYRGNPAFPLDKWVEDEEFVAFPTLGERPNPELVRTLPNDMLQELRYHAYEWYLLAASEEDRRRYEGGGFGNSYNRGRRYGGEAGLG